MKVSRVSLSADVKAAEELLETLDKLTMKENYQSKYSVWVKLSYSESTFIRKEGMSMSGFKAFKDRRRVLFGG